MKKVILGSMFAFALIVVELRAQIQIQVQGNVAQADIALIAPGGMPFPGNAGSTNWNMLQQKDVREDIKLTKEQDEKLKAVEATKDKDLTELVKKGGRAYLLGFKDTLKQFEKGIESALTPEQYNRLDQIRFQQAARYGLPQAILYNAEWQDKFKVTEEQRKQINVLQQEMNLAMGGLPNNIPFQERQAAQQTIREATDEQIAKDVLNKEQQTLLNKLRGKPFKGLNQVGRVIRPVPLPRPVPVPPVDRNKE